MPNSRNSAWGGTGGDGTATLVGSGTQGLPALPAESYGAVGDDATDNSASMLNALTAAGVGGRTSFGAGTFRGGDLALPFEMASLYGVGRHKTYWKAKTAATYALDITKLRDVTLADFTIDGNGKASKGLRMRGGASGSGSERNGLERMGFYQCSTALDITTAVVDQVDKNTYNRVFFDSNTKAVVVNSINGQQQHFTDCHIEHPDASTTGIELTNGSVEWNGGQIGMNGGTGVLLNGTTIQWLTLQDVIFEGQTIGIDGNTNWPLNGVKIIGGVIDGSTAAVRIGAVGAGARLVGIGARFNGGGIVVNGNDVTFEDHGCTDQNGNPVLVTGTGTNFRHCGVGKFPILNVASAGTVTLPFGAETYSITGVANIDRIEPFGWCGLTVKLTFTSTATVRHNFNNIFLVGAANFAATANDSLWLRCDGSNFYEVARAVV